MLWGATGHVGDATVPCPAHSYPHLLPSGPIPPLPATFRCCLHGRSAREPYAFTLWEFIQVGSWHVRDATLATSSSRGSLVSDWGLSPCPPRGLDTTQYTESCCHHHTKLMADAHDAGFASLIHSPLSVYRRG